MSAAYDTLIASAARRHDVPFALVKAMIKVESGFKATAFRNEPAINDASRGLMQILLRTARGLRPSVTPEQLLDPATNIDLGTQYLAQQIRRYGGDIWSGVAAYNAGSAKRATKETRFCLARDQKSGECVRWFTAKPGQFLNQPYVDKVAQAYAQYSAEEAGRTAVAQTPTGTPAGGGPLTPAAPMSPRVQAAGIGLSVLALLGAVAAYLLRR